VTLALFDLDYTLLAGDSDHSWGLFLAEKGVADTADFADRSDYYMGEYNAGRLDMREFLDFQLAPLAGTAREDLVPLRQEFLDRRIEPMITESAQRLVAGHRDRGHTLVVITATNDFVTRPIAERFGIDNLLATELEVVDGVFTGAIKGEPCFREGKVAHLDRWMSRAGVDLAGSWFYSDSRNDLPLLERVDHPVAVNPDAVLEAEAGRRGWPVCRL